MLKPISLVSVSNKLNLHYVSSRSFRSRQVGNMIHFVGALVLDLVGWGFRGFLLIVVSFRGGRIIKSNKKETGMAYSD